MSTSLFAIRTRISERCWTCYRHGDRQRATHCMRACGRVWEESWRGSAPDGASAGHGGRSWRAVDRRLSNGGWLVAPPAEALSGVTRSERVNPSPAPDRFPSGMEARRAAKNRPARANERGGSSAPLAVILTPWNPPQRHRVMNLILIPLVLVLVFPLFPSVIAPVGRSTLFPVSGRDFLVIGHGDGQDRPRHLANDQRIPRAVVVR